MVIPWGFKSPRPHRAYVPRSSLHGESKLNIQVEHLDNHMARLKVEITQEVLDKAMQSAARRIGQKVNIPGFRRGKAPYGVVLRYVGQGAVLEEALDTLGNDVYASALTQSAIEPYAPGTLEKFDTNPPITLTFTVPKQPRADLGDYRVIRIPYEAPVVEDKMVDEALEDIRAERAVIEPATRPAQLGDMVHGSVYGEMIHPAHEHTHGEEAEPEKPVDAPEGEASEKHEEDEHEHEGHTETIIDRDDFDFVLYPKTQEDRDLVPGFADQIVGMSAGDSKSFTIDFPDDHENKSLAGHSFKFDVTVQEVKSRTLPDLNDDLAEKSSEGKFKTLLELRVDVRRELQASMERQTTSQYADKMLAKIIEQAVVSYPEEMVKDYTSRMLQSLDRNLRQQGLTLERLMQVQGKNEEALRADYRENAILQIKRDVVLSEIVEREGLTVSDEAITARIDEMTSRFSEDASQAASFRRMFERPEARVSLVNDLMTEALQQRLTAIGKGDELPELKPVALAAETNTASAESTPTTAQEQPETAPSGDAAPGADA